jgi:hypothetical protein
MALVTTLPSWRDAIEGSRWCYRRWSDAAIDSPKRPNWCCFSTTFLSHQNQKDKIRFFECVCVNSQRGYAGKKGTGNLRESQGGKKTQFSMDIGDEQKKKKSKR